MTMIIIIAIITICILLVSFVLLRRGHAGIKRLAVVVVGDIGRSPRMQYHSLSFARSGFAVELVGYSGKTMQQSV